jgi:hypothetical protein
MLEAQADRVAAQKREAERRPCATGKGRGLAERILADEARRIHNERMTYSIGRPDPRLMTG